MLTHLRLPATAKRSRRIGIMLCLIVASAAFSGCTSGHSPSSAAHSRSSARSRDGQPATTVRARQSGRVVKHWGSFFGAQAGNFDIQTSPVAVTLPGAVREVGSSNSTEYALLTDGSLYAWGMGNRGQLGNGGSANSFNQAVQVHFPPGVQIAWIPTDAMPFDAGLAVDTRGRVWGWGSDRWGDFCLGNTRSYATPKRLPLPHVTALAGASNHVLYDSRGVVYACGQNVDGDLGIGSFRSTTTPVRVHGLAPSSVTELVASFANSGALLSDGEYLDWGFNGGGQLGDGHRRGKSDVPVRVHLSHRVVEVALGGSIWVNGQTLVKLSDGSLWAWGNNRHHQLGGGSRLLQPRPIRFYAPAGVTYVSLATGSATSYGISSTGAVYAWGASQLGQVGDHLRVTARRPTLVARNATQISSTANNVVISTGASNPGGAPG
ncbi:MAG TPA: hypothetical protein VEV61_02930 [Streptosporangiaceae bacterium]|nr:hypothetical protein [Streptosporangiaceae bacterium]